MNNDRMQALGQYEATKKQLYELGIKAQSMVNSIFEETNSFLTDKDFSTMDFKMIETLAKELQQLQSDYNEKSLRMKKLKETYNF